MSKLRASQQASEPTYTTPSSMHASSNSSADQRLPNPITKSSKHVLQSVPFDSSSDNEDAHSYLSAMSVNAAQSGRRVLVDAQVTSVLRRVPFATTDQSNGSSSAEHSAVGRTRSNPPLQFLNCCVALRVLSINPSSTRCSLGCWMRSPTPPPRKRLTPTSTMHSLHGTTGRD